MSKRTFNGCWTCRSRKVKCDGRSPFCARCEKSGFECQGYHIKLSFYQSLTTSDTGQLITLVDDNVDGSGKPGEKNPRRSMELVKYPKSMIYETFAHLNEQLERIDEGVRLGLDRMTVGPFGVYPNRGIGKGSRVIVQSANGPSSKYRKISDISKRLQKTQLLQNLDRQHQDRLKNSATPQNPDSDMAVERDGPIHRSLVSLARLSILAIKGPDYIINDQNIHHITYPTFYPNIDSDEWELPHDHMAELVKENSIGDIALRSRYCELVRFYDELTPQFIKINHDGGFWDRYVRPKLHQVAWEYVVYGANWKKTVELDEDKFDDIYNHLKLALHLATVSLSAFKRSPGSKFETVEDNDISLDLRLSICLRKQSLNKLNFHLDNYDEFELSDPTHGYNTLLLLAIIVQVELDTYFNVIENFELLFSIGELVTSSLRQDGSDLSIVLTTMFDIMITFYQLTQRINVYNYTIAAEDMDKYGDLKETYDLSRDTSMAESHSTANVRNLFEFRQTAERLTPYRLVDRPDLNDYSVDDEHEPQTLVYKAYGLPKSLLLLLADAVKLANHKRVFFTERRYPRNFPRICAELEEKIESWKHPWKLQENGTFKSPVDEAVYTIAMIVHTSIKVYFKRLINNQFDEGHLKFVLQKMERLFALKVDVAPPFWALFICASEGSSPMFEIGDMMPKFLERDLTYWRARQVVIEVHNRHQDEPTTWMETIRDWDIVLYLG